MDWHTDNLQQLAASPCCGYSGGDSAVTEPTALTALALMAAGRLREARRATDWLASLQDREGSIGVRRTETTPRWPTSLAVLAWLKAAGGSNVGGSYRTAIERAVAWILTQQGETYDRTKAAGHDPTLVAWPWVEGTHSWIEPTALHVLALKAAGLSAHPRVREAVRVLIDRQIPGGGCNYGNTTILGQQLRPHIQPTGTALLALAGESDRYGRIRQSIRYLERTVSSDTSTVSLCWALLGLSAHKRPPAAAREWLEGHIRAKEATGQSPLKRALLCLAVQGAAGLSVSGHPASTRTAT